MRNYASEFAANIKFLNSFLAPFNQGILTRAPNCSLLRQLVNLWPVWYSCLWVALYAYLILSQRAGPEIVSQQMLSMFCIVQLVAKQLNAKFQVDLLRKLLRWCEDVYTVRLQREHQAVVDSVFEETNQTITQCIRINCALLGSAAASYLLQPLLLGNRATPTLISINGTVYWPMHTFLVIYVGQVIYGVCVCFLLSGYDAIFIQCIMTMSYRFRTMARLLQLLNVTDGRKKEDGRAKDKEIIGLVYNMHCSVLEATISFREYYSVYGLIQLASNLFMNCSLLYILQANGYDSNIFVILLSSSLQILIVSAFGQQLQNEATAFRNTLYTIDWPRMSIESRKRILLLMSGSSRVVTVRAGGAYELNLALFAQVMKAGVSLCAVMRAM